MSSSVPPLKRGVLLFGVKIIFTQEIFFSTMSFKKSGTYFCASLIHSF